VGKVKRFRAKRWYGADPCVYCLQPATTDEHILPRSRGGRDVWENRAACCHACNRDRANRPLLVWLIVRELKRRGRVQAAYYQSKACKFTKQDERRWGLDVATWAQL
jgi:hypothetical protein